MDLLLKIPPPLTEDKEMSANYNEIGIHYDITRRADPQIVRKLAEFSEIETNKKYLDIACGTGNYTFELSKLGGQWFGFDQSEKMLYEANLKTNSVIWSCLDVAQLGYRDKEFDGAICSLAIHHFPNIDLAFSEIARVLKPNSKLVIFTSTPEQMQHYWLTQYFPEMMKKSCAQMPSLTSIQTSLSRYNLTVTTTEPFFIDSELKDFFLYSGKYRPEIYLSPEVRNGISSFKNFCSDSELASGPESLAADIKSGNIKRLLDKNNSLGDYMFITSRKHSI